jgi:hypothetical protein
LTHPLQPKSGVPANASLKPVINNIFDFSAEALGEVRTWLEQNPPFIPITQIIGFSQFAAQVAIVQTLESTTSTTYTDLSTVGPELTGLPDGQYVVVVSAAGLNSGAVDGWMSYSVNGGTAVDSTGSRSSGTSLAGVIMFSTPTLKNNGNNSIVAKYRTSGGTSQFTNRCLFALRFANS